LPVHREYYKALSVSHPVLTRDTNREYYKALSVSHPVLTRDTNIIPRALARGMILVEGWYGMWKSYLATWLITGEKLVGPYNWTFCIAL
jgi:hypothetical protein